MTSDQPKGTFTLIPHTHWEGAVFKTRAQYLDIGMPIILRALALLKKHPHYRFTLDQVCYVKPFLERYPEEAGAFRRFVNEGRLGIVGGTDSMLDVNMPGGESFVRQVLYGKGFFRDALGVDVRESWQLDTFGHHAQMPQLLKLAGFDSFWFFRGVPNMDSPGEFLWEGIDGSRIPSVWMPHGYAVTYGSPSTLPEFSQFMRERHDLVAAYHSPDRRVGAGGADVCLPEEHLPEMVDAFNAQADAPFELRLATPGEYGAPADDSPVLKCELNPVFQGIYSSRIELKQWTRELESLLMTAEKLGVVLASQGMPVDDGILWRAWEPMLFNQAHDLMAGVMTDHVWDDTAATFDGALRIAREETDARLRQYGSTVDTQGDGVALVVFNSLGWTRTDVVTATVGFTEADVVGLELRGPDGQPVPVQILRSETDGGGALIEAEIAFIASDVPALGHAIYRVMPLDEPVAESASVPTSCGVLENGLYRVEVDPATGAMTSVVVKDGDWDALSAPGNIVVREDDHGDLWEPYKPLDGGSRIAMTEPHPIAPRGEAVYSDEQTGETGAGFTGPVVSQFTVAHPFGEEGEFTTTVRVYAGLPRIDIRTSILNNSEFVRYRVMFPTSIADEQGTHEIPFGAIERPDEIEFPAQNWVDCGNGEKGVALLNRGLPGNATYGGTMLLSLCRSTQIVAYGFGGGYEPGMTSHTGFELGKRLTFDYSLVPHAGSWCDAGVTREGMALNVPLIAQTAASHVGTLPSRAGYIEAEPANVVVTTLKTSRDGMAALRIYEASGAATPGARIRLLGGATRVDEVDLMEDPIREMTVSDGAVEFDLGAFEIKTFRFSLEPANGA